MQISLVRMSDSIGSGFAGPYHAHVAELREGGRYQRMDYVEALAVVGGEGRHVIETTDGTRVAQRLHPGQMFLYRPSDVTAIEGFGAHGVSLVLVAIPFADWQIFADFAGIDPSWHSGRQPPAAYFDPDDEVSLSPFYTALRRYREGATRLDLLRFMTDITSYFLPLRDRSSPGWGAPGWLARSVEAMHQEDNMRGGVVRLVELAHVSRSHLSRSVRRYYGVTPSALLNDLRLRRAAVLLSTTKESVGSISERCGFSSVPYFSSRFRRSYEISPRIYRTRFSENGHTATG
jgi:AraC-like DNA-binding protein